MLGFTFFTHKTALLSGRFSFGVHADSCLTVQPNLRDFLSTECYLMRQIVPLKLGRLNK